MFLPLVLLRNEYQGVFFLLEKAGKSACMEQEKALANVKPGRGKKKKALGSWGAKLLAVPAQPGFCGMS